MSITKRMEGVDIFMTENNGATSQQIDRNIPMLRDLRAANNPPVYVNRDTELSKAFTIMMINDFSQLPIMQGERTVEGYISWRTIGEALALRRECNTVRDCMDKLVTILDDTEPLLNAVNAIARKDFILVRSKDNRIVGLVTASDITTSFYALAEPFFLIAQIEHSLRQIIDQYFNQEEIQAAKDPSDENRTVNNASDLTFGEYLRLLENEKNWERLNKYPISRDVLLSQLRIVKDIRNGIMHFRPNGLPYEKVQTLRNMLSFLEHLS